MTLKGGIIDNLGFIMLNMSIFTEIKNYNEYRNSKILQ